MKSDPSAEVAAFLDAEERAAEREFDRRLVTALLKSAGPSGRLLVGPDEFWWLHRYAIEETSALFANSNWRANKGSFWLLGVIVEMRK